MLLNQQVYSFLYPFSFGFYRKFGYEHCNSILEAKIPLRQMGRFPFPGAAQAYEPGDDAGSYARLYETFARGRNLSVVRDEGAWRRILDRDPYKKLQFTYLLGPKDSPTAYVLYDSKRVRGKSYSLYVKELCFQSTQGLYDALGFLGRLSPECQHMFWNVPQGVNAHMLCSDLYDIELTEQAFGMGRVVDVLAALGGLHAPTHPSGGRVSIKVVDDFINENTGFYQVEWESGTLSAKRLGMSVGACDLETSVMGLMQLVSGFATPEMAECRRDTIVSGNRELLHALFAKRRMYIMERF